MSLIIRLGLLLGGRLSGLIGDRPGRWPDGDDPERGDGPVPTAIIIAGLAVLAAAVVAWGFGLVDDFMDTAVPGTPDAPAPPGP